MPNVGKNKMWLIIVNMSLIREGLRHKVVYRIVISLLTLNKVNLVKTSSFKK